MLLDVFEVLLALNNRIKISAIGDIDLKRTEIR